MKNKLLMVLLPIIVATLLVSCGRIAKVDGKISVVTWDRDIEPIARNACQEAAVLSVRDPAFELAATNDCVEYLKFYFDSHSEFGVYWPGPGNPNLDSSPASEAANFVAFYWGYNNWVDSNLDAYGNLMASFKEARLLLEQSIKPIQ